MPLPLTQNERDARQNNIRFEMKDHCLKGALELPTCERQRSLLKSVPSVATKWNFFPPTLTCNAANAGLLSLTTLIRAPDGVYIPKSAGDPTSQEKLKKRRGTLLGRYKQLRAAVIEAHRVNFSISHHLLLNSTTKW